MGATPETSAVPPLCCEHHGDQQKPVNDHHDILKLPSLKQIKVKPIGMHCVAIFYILFALVLLIIALAELVISASNTIITEFFNSKASDRVIGTIILAICATITSLAAICSIFAVCKRNSKALHVVLIILAIIVITQILLIAFAVTVKGDDIRSLEASLTESFIRAEKDHNEADIKFWDYTQNDLKCCGLHGPEDFREPEAPYLPVKVPFSCCELYNKTETDFHVKWHRHLCILNRTYYGEGCFKIVANLFQKTTKITVGVSILLIVLEVVMIGIGFYMCRESSAAKSKKDNTEEATTA